MTTKYLDVNRASSWTVVSTNYISNKDPIFGTNVVYHIISSLAIG
jgi:hypothetical protein